MADQISDLLIAYIFVFLYGCLAIGSLGVFTAWVPAVRALYRRHGGEMEMADLIDRAHGIAGFSTRIYGRVPGVRTLWALRWSKPFQIAVAVAQLAVGVGLGATWRAIDIITNGMHINLLWDLVMIGVLLLLMDAKRRLVRAGAITEKRTLRWPWYVFGATLILWLGAVALHCAFFVFYGLSPAFGVVG